MPTFATIYLSPLRFMIREGGEEGGGGGGGGRGDLRQMEMLTQWEILGGTGTLLSGQSESTGAPDFNL